MPQVTNNGEVTKSEKEIDITVFWQKFALDLERLAGIIQQIDSYQKPP